jgi:hypothetical protein
MQRVPADSEQRNPLVPAVRLRAIQKASQQKEHRDTLGSEQQEAGHVEDNRIQTSSDSVVDCQRRRYQWAIALVGRNRTERPGAPEEQRNVAEFANVSIILDGMCIVEMKRIAEMTSVNRYDGG